MRPSLFAPLLLLASGCGETTYAITAVSAPAAYASTDTHHADDSFGSSSPEDSHDPPSPSTSGPATLPARDVLVL